MELINADIIIPARYSSSRFPGKPLAVINGKTLIQRVAEICISVVGVHRVWIATDDRRIIDFCHNEGLQTILTKSECLTGTDRVAEASLTLSSEIIINVQGDEPCINADDIRSVYLAKKMNQNCVINGYCEFETDLETLETNIPKVVVDKNLKLLYISRSNIPFTHKASKESKVNLKRQVCIYAFSPAELKLFSSLGRRGEIEDLEDIEILRFIELGIQVQMVELHSSIAVDLPGDIQKVEEFLNRGSLT